MPDQKNNQPLGASIGEIVERTTTLIHEEIELAKTEMAVGAQNLLRGSVAGILGGVFAFFGLFILLMGIAFLINDALGVNYVWPGFLIVAFALFLLGGAAAFVALKKIKKGSQIVPKQAIAEAKKTQSALKPDEKPSIQHLEAEAIEETPPSSPATPIDPAPKPKLDPKPTPTPATPAADPVAEAKPSTLAPDSPLAPVESVQPVNLVDHFKHNAPRDVDEVHPAAEPFKLAEADKPKKSRRFGLKQKTYDPPPADDAAAKSKDKPAKSEKPPKPPKTPKPPKEKKQKKAKKAKGDGTPEAAVKPIFTTDDPPQPPIGEDS